MFGLEAAAAKASVEIAKSVIAYGTAGTVGAVGVLSSLNLLHLEREVHTDGGDASLEKVFVTLPELCQDAYTDHVEGAQAAWSIKAKGHIGSLHLSFPTGVSQTSTFNGDITNKVCRNEVKVHPKLETDGKVHIVIQPDAYETFSYITNPVKDAPYTTHNGPLSVIDKNFDNLAHAIPKVEYKGVADSMAGRMGGLAVVEAEATSSEKCGPQAYSYLRPMQVDSVNQDLQQGIEVAEMLNPNIKVDMSKIVVDLPADNEVKFTDQYDSTIDQAKAGLGSSLTITGAVAGTCEKSPALAKYMAAHPDQYEGKQ